MLEQRRADASRISHIQVADHAWEAKIRDLTDRAKRDARAVRWLTVSLLMFAPAAIMLRGAQSYITADALFDLQNGISPFATAKLLAGFYDRLLVVGALAFAVIMIWTAAPHRFSHGELITSVLVTSSRTSTSPSFSKDGFV